MRLEMLRDLSMHNFKQVSLGMMQRHDQKRYILPAVCLGPDGKTPHSWRVAILPFIDECGCTACINSTNRGIAQTI